jgi:hypothetical protein
LFCRIFAPPLSAFFLFPLPLPTPPAIKTHLQIQCF